jgi:hydroxylaminobenzene mutase
MPLIVKLGICELAVAALSGWAMVAIVEKPEALRRLGLHHLGRIRQAHLDLLFMGTILTAVGVAMDPVPTWIGALLVLGAYMQPLMFVPLAVNSELRQDLAYRVLNTMLFVGFSVAWVALAATALSR